MSTTYSYTRDPYSQIVGWPGYVPLPADGDPFYALSANLYEKAIQDRNMYIFEGALKNMNMNGAIRMGSSNGSTITVYPFIVQAFDGTNYTIEKYDIPTVISSANLDPAGSFSADTWYYVYLKNTGASKIVISDAVPHVYLLYLDSMGAQVLNTKYLGCFRTDALGNINKFFKNGVEVRYPTEVPAVLAGTATSATPVSMADFIPPHAHIVHLKADVYNGNNVNNNVSLYSTNPPGLRINVAPDDLTSKAVHTTELTLNTTPMQEITYSWATSGANVSKLDLYVVGYRE